MFNDKSIAQLERTYNWASEASPTLGCSIEISRDIYVCFCRMSNHVESHESNTRMLKGVAVKAGLWTLDWTVDWTMDWTMDWTVDWNMD